MRTTFKKEEQKHTGKSEFIGATGFFFSDVVAAVTTAAVELNIYQCVAIIVSLSLCARASERTTFNIPQ